MSLTKFVPVEVLKTCGFLNPGSMCYLNSFLQSLLSCTSVTKFFLENSEMFHRQNNKVAIEYIKIIREVKDAKVFSHPINPSNILRSIIAETKKKYPYKQFGRGQEDSGESLHLFLDSIDNRELYNLFMYKYTIKLWCLNCVKQLSESSDESCIFEIPPDFNKYALDETKNTLNEYIRQYISVIDDYTCPECKKQQCCRIYQIVRVPDIIIIMFNKFFNKQTIEFPRILTFPSTTGAFYYKIVADIEHSGGQANGHYWSQCLRRGLAGSQIHKLDDNIIAAGSHIPSQNSYIIFYHNY